VQKNPKLKLSPQLANSLVEYCKEHFILPDDVIRVATRQNPNEPFLLDARQLGGATETERMMRILTALWSVAPESFETAAAGIRGHKRVWFSKSSAEIHDSGNSNFCQRIPGSPWFVSTNCPMEGMRSRVVKVMERMGFSSRYSVFVAWSIYDQKARLYPNNFFDNECSA
jgi:hypothetical protein